MKGHWSFSQQKGDAGFNPQSLRSKDLGEHSIKTFVREFVQNTLDVRLDKNKPAEITFLIKNLSGSEIAALKNNLGDDFLKMFKNSFLESDPDEREKLEKGYKFLFEDEPGFSLIVTEKNCVGLTGAEKVQSKTDKSNYDALCRKVNKNTKEDSNSGGTWGKGSSIYTFSSLIRTWFAYSVLSKEWNGQQKRFIGRCQLAPFTDYNEPITSYHGQGWFCRKEQKEGDIGLPLTNADADNYATLFGIPLRQDNDYGTTFFVPAFNPNLEKEDLNSVVNEFRDQTLLNWFIALYEGKLIVRIEGGSESIVIDKSYLDKVEPLKYKLEILDWYYKGRPDNPNFFIKSIEIEIPPLKKLFQEDRKISYASQSRKVTLDLVIRKLEEFETHDDTWNTANKVAMVRGENGMLINHFNPNLKFLDDQKIKTESILFSGLMERNSDENTRRHSDLFFAFAENPDHNQWCYEEWKMNSESYLDRFEELQRGGRGRKIKPTRIIYDLLFSDLYRSFLDFFQKSKEAETGNKICQLFQKLASLKKPGSSQTAETLVSIRQNQRYDYPEVDKDGRFIYHYIMQLIKTDRIAEVSLEAALDTWEGEVADFTDLGVPEFERISIIDDDNGTLIDSGTTPKLTLDKNRTEMKVAIKTCPIVPKNTFQNLQPKIKIKISGN